MNYKTQVLEGIMKQVSWTDTTGYQNKFGREMQFQKRIFFLKQFERIYQAMPPLRGFNMHLFGYKYQEPSVGQ
jgi:hypothetical protein